jgi:hypothetical protein
MTRISLIVAIAVVMFGIGYTTARLVFKATHPWSTYTREGIPYGVYTSQTLTNEQLQQLSACWSSVLSK